MTLVSRGMAVSAFVSGVLEMDSYIRKIIARQYKIQYTCVEHQEESVGKPMATDDIIFDPEA